MRLDIPPKPLTAMNELSTHTFIPLFEERYELVLPREQEVILASLLNYI